VSLLFEFGGVKFFRGRIRGASISPPFLSKRKSQVSE
jgi:hypothetical protein